MMTAISSKNEEIKRKMCAFLAKNFTVCNNHYNIAESRKIGEVYETIEDQAVIKELLSDVTVVVLTANKYEKNILHHNICYTKNHGEKIKRMSITLYPECELKISTYGYLFKWNNYTILHIEAQTTGSYTIGGSADITRFVINNPLISPRVIVSLGICFGTDEQKHNLGDTIISEKVYPCFIGAKINESGLSVKDDNMFSINPKLRMSIRSACDKNIFNKDTEGKVYLGNYITGEAVVSSIEVRNLFANTTTQEIVAGEMEGYGLFKECSTIPNSVPCLIVKSICDWGAMKNFDPKPILDKMPTIRETLAEETSETIKSKVQAYAAFQAYKTMDILLKNDVCVLG